MLYPNYVKTPTHCIINYVNNERLSRNILTAQLKNKFNKNFLFILMNPSKADEEDSDNTINKCAKIAYHNLMDLKIGEFTIVNAYPFYESDSSKLDNISSNIKEKYCDLYYKELMKNLSYIKQAIQLSDYVLLGTGAIPNEISNKSEYQFVLDTIHSYVETFKGTVYLGTSKEKYNGKYILKGRYSYHICPKGNPHTIDRIKLHRINRGKFIDISKEKEIIIT
ncbi:DUF1643 domain-containing protein [Bacillus sp. 1A]|uniref:DUF1643 domain-containing protein n=1 Tax=Bacillus sp. 1A TaxID=3461399 RepID=UPI004044F1E5